VVLSDKTTKYDAAEAVDRCTLTFPCWCFFDAQLRIKQNPEILTLPTRVVFVGEKLGKFPVTGFTLPWHWIKKNLPRWGSHFPRHWLSFCKTYQEKKCKIKYILFPFSVFITDNNVLPYSHSRVNDDCFICDVFFPTDRVFSLLTKLKPRTSGGPDGLSALFLNNVAGSLAIPLSLLFRTSYELSTIAYYLEVRYCYTCI